MTIDIETLGDGARTVEMGAPSMPDLLPVLPLRAATLQSPGLGMDVDVFDESWKSLVGEVGYLVCKQPAPSFTRSIALPINSRAVSTSSCQPMETAVM